MATVWRSCPRCRPTHGRAYRGRVSGIAVYTGLRIALLVIVWLVIQAVTPLRGLIAVAVALVISGIISFFALDRPRSQASRGVAGIFRRIDERIERSTTAEDIDDEPVPSRQADAQAEQEPIAQEQQARPLEDGDQRPSNGTA